jgi:predicted amidophosphoribosyltransferase
MREVLGQYKYRGNERLAPVLGQMLDRAYSMLEEERNKAKLNNLRPLIDRATPFPARKSSVRSGLWQADLLVPVPVSAVRLTERGFNQAERMADVLSRRRGIPQLPLLLRTLHTGKQSFKSRSERLADMKHAFTGNTDTEIIEKLEHHIESIAARLQLRPLQLIIIDDIYTTGSTIRSCAEALHRLCGSMGCAVEIYSLTWARS